MNFYSSRTFLELNVFCQHGSKTVVFFGTVAWKEVVVRMGRREVVRRMGVGVGSQSKRGREEHRGEVAAVKVGRPVELTSWVVEVSLD